MRKFYLFVLMAVGLLIGTNVWANLPQRVEVRQPEPLRPVLTELPSFKNGVQKAPIRKAPAEAMVAQIGETKYPTVQAAFDAVPTDGTETTVKLLDNADEPDNVLVYGGRNIKLDLQGHTLNFTTAQTCIWVKVYYDAEKDGLYIANTDDKLTVINGTLKTTKNGFYNYGTTILTNVTIDDGNYAIQNLGGTLTLNDVDVWYVYNTAELNYNSGIMRGYLYQNGGTVNMTGGSINTSAKVYAGTFNMTAGQVTGNTLYIYGGEMNVSGGEISYDGADYYTILIYTSNSNGSIATLNISGGTFKHSAYSCIWKYSGNLNITGGTFDDTESQLPGGYIWFDNGDGTYTAKKSVASVEGSNDTFETLAAAVAAAPENGKISLLYDITEDVTINKPVTLNTTAYPYSLNGKVTADGAKVAIMGDGGVADFEAVNGGQIEIVSGTFTKDPTSYLARNSKIVEGTAYTVVHSVICVEVDQERKEYFSDLKSAFDYVQNLEGDNYVIDVLEDFEFKVDNGRYITLNKGKKITLNLNGHHVHGIMDAHETITSWAEMIYVTKGHFIVEDLSGDETGIMSFEQINPEPKTWYGNYMINVQSGATFTLKSGTLTNNTKHSTFAIAVSVEIEGGTANIEGGKILGVNSTSCIRPYNSGTLNISGGYLSATAYHMIFIQQSEGASDKIEINITGGEFEHLGGGHAISCFATNVGQLGNCTININGGKFDSRTIGFSLTGENNHWGGTAWNRDEWNALYRNLFHATDGQFADNTFSISGTDADGASFSYKPSLAEILDSDYDLFTQESEDYPFTIGPKVITESTGDGNWEDLFPDSEAENIQVEHQVTVIEEYTEAYSLNVQSTGEIIVKEGATLDLTWGLVMEDGAKMTVEPGATLKIGVAGIQNTSNSRIVVQSNTEHSAIVTFDPEAFLFSDPYIEVDFTTKAYYTTKTTSDGEINWYKWQDFGIPTRLAPTFTALEATTRVMRMNVKTGEYEPLVNAVSDGTRTKIVDLNEPFRGYIITNLLSEPGFTYKMTGRMVAAENQKLNFEVTTSKDENFNFFANSFLTPIDVKTFLQGISDEDENIERTVHVFNSANDTYESVNITDLKYGTADYTTIAPMQAFYMSTQKRVKASATLNYRNSVWGQTSTEPMHAPQRMKENVNLFNLYAGTENAKDKLTLIESDNFTDNYENGSDAVKYMNADFNIFVTTERGNQSIVATDQLEGTILTFQAGDDVVYNLSFDRVHGSDYCVKDLKNNQMVEVNEGSTYTFVAEPKSTEPRFQIVRRASEVATDMEEISENTNVKGIYTVLGQFVGASDAWKTLPAGVYVVDGIKIVK